MEENPAQPSQQEAPQYNLSLEDHEYADRKRAYYGQERRRHFRIYYPKAATPKLVNCNFKVIDLSMEGIQFAVNRPSGDEPEPEPDQNIEMKLRFNDADTANISVRVLRKHEDKNTGKTLWSGRIEHGLSPSRISKEQAYLLRHYPDFCRAVFV